MREAVEFGATEICMQSGIHPDWTLADYEHWLRVIKETAPQLHLHAYSPMEVAHICDISGPGARRGLCAPARGGPRLDAGTAAEVLHDGVRERISPEQAAGRALGRDHRGLPPRRACARRRR